MGGDDDGGLTYFEVTATFADGERTIPVPATDAADAVGVFLRSPASRNYITIKGLRVRQQ